MHIVCPHCHRVNRVPAERLGDGGACGTCKRPLFLGEPLALTADQFDTHIQRSDIPLIVDFWAPWCGPCRMMTPSFAQAAGELEPHYRLVKVDTEQEQSLATRYGIRSIPTLVVFRNGQEVARQAGAMDTARLIQWIRQS